MSNRTESRTSDRPTAILPSPFVPEAPKSEPMFRCSEMYRIPSFAYIGDEMETTVRVTS